jgi:hypothetical protein
VSQGAESEPSPPAAPVPAAPVPTDPAPVEPPRAEPEEPHDEAEPKKPGGIVAQVIGTTSFFAALLVYMGWNYESLFLQQFLIPVPQGIGLGTVDFAATGITPLFSSNAVLFAAALVGLILIAPRLARRLPEPERKRLVAGIGKASGPLFWTGVVLTALLLLFTWPQVSDGGFVGWFTDNVDLVYLALALLAGAQLLMAWPSRRSIAGQVAYPLALVVVAVLALWAGGIYAGTLGFQYALSVEYNVPGQIAATVYSAQPLDLSGPGVTCRRIQTGPGYPFQCTGLRLLYLQSGTYYLLPVGWSYHNQQTYILDDSDQIRVELSCPSVSNPVPLTCPSR